MEPVLRVMDATKQYGQTRALNGANMDLRAGEWLALLGPNGAGKTTLIRAVAGRVRLDEGSITLLGQQLTGTSNGHAAADQDSRHRLGVVPQEIALYPLLTAEENLRAFGALHGISGSELHDRVQWALDWTGLADRARSLVKTFSGGMKRRLNIACGVLHRPQVVLLDEPTVGVDPQSRQRIWDMLSALREDGAALLLTTHQLDEAQQICERIVIIDHGTTIADGTLNELIEQTIGRGRQVTLLLCEPLVGGALDDRFVVNGSSVVATVHDVATELPSLLEHMRAAGGRVMDIRIEAPTLHAVFLHLTGRELRE